MTVTGDGRPENEFIFVGEKLWKENAMLKLIEDIPTPSPIKQSRELLNEKIFRYFLPALFGMASACFAKHVLKFMTECIIDCALSIEEEGQTALGGALLVSIELAKRAPGSKV